MAVTGEPLSGTDGAFFVDTGAGGTGTGTEVTMQKWEWTPAGNVMNVPNFRGKGFNEVLGGLSKSQMRCSCYWDANQNPNQSPPMIQDLEYIQDVKMYLRRPGLISPTDPGIFIFVPWMLIETVPIRDDVEGKCEYEFTAHSDGPYYYPGDSIPSTDPEEETDDEDGGGGS
jgi:hypothetical protein